MENSKSNIAEPVKGVSVAASIGSLTTILVNVVKVTYPLGDPTLPDYTIRQEWQNIWISIVVFSVPLLIHILVLAFKPFFVTREEKNLRAKYNDDLKEYEKTFKAIEEHPERFNAQDIEMFRNEYAQTLRQLHNIGKRS